MNNNELFDRLNTTHPDYKEWKSEWTRYRDVLGDELVEKTDYLPRNVFEPNSQYNFRTEISQFIPESALALERLLGALYREKPKRDWKGSEQKAELDKFLESADRKGRSWNTVVEKIAFKLCGYGTTRALVNVLPHNLPETGLVSDGGLTRAEEKEMPSLRPFVINYSPLSVIDWEHDENGILNICRIKEDRIIRATDGDLKKPHRKETKFIEYDRTEVRWWVFQENRNGEMQLSSANPERRAHDLGMVPMVIDDLREVRPFIGHSFIRYSSRADIRKFQAESDQAYDTYMHAHPFLAIWTDDDLKEVGLGTSAFLKLRPGTGTVGREDAKYMDPPTSAFDALERVIEENRTLIYRQAQVDPMGVIQGGQPANFQASGVSRAWSFGTSEARILSKIADRMQSIERQIFELVIRFLDRTKMAPADERLFKGSINYPEEFDLSSTAQLIEERSQIGMMVNSPTLLRIIDKRIASSKVGDATAQELAKIHLEIDKNPLLGTMAGKTTTDPFASPFSSQGEGGEDDEEDQEDQDNGKKPPNQKGKIAQNSRFAKR